MQRPELEYPTCDESFLKRQAGQCIEVQTTIRGEINAIKKQKYTVFLWITFSVLLITFFQFLGMLFEPLYYPPLLGMVVYFFVSVIVFAIVALLWVNYIKPEEHVWVMATAFARILPTKFLNDVFGLKDENAHDASQGGSIRHAENHSVWAGLALLISVFVSFGFALSTLISWSYGYARQNNIAELQNNVTELFQGQPSHPPGAFPVAPVVVIVVLAAIGALVYAFLYAHKRRSIPVVFTWGLASTTALSAIDVILVLYGHHLYVWPDIVSYVSTTQTAIDYFNLVSHVVVLTATVLLLAVIWQHILDLKNFYSCTIDDGATDAQKIVALLPKRVRLNSSHTIFVCTQLADEFVSRGKAARGVAQIRGSKDAAYHLELELQGSGIKFDRAKHATIREGQDVTTTAWTCSFASPGVQTINIILNRVGSYDSDKRPMFFHRHVVTVDNFFTVTWLPILAAIIPILTAFIAALWH